MHVQVLSSGSEGNSTLIRCGEAALLVDSGLPAGEQRRRMARAGLAPRAVDHVLVTHGHLDHARSSGIVAKRERATLHAPERYLTHSVFRRAPRVSAITTGRTFTVRGARGQDEVAILPVLLPHDCDPTVAYRIEHEGRVAVVVTDMGHPRPEVAQKLAGAHLLVLEFNYDPRLMETGPYGPELRRRITGDRGHLSNEQAARMLELLMGPELHTLVIAHVSQKTNRPDLALSAACSALDRMGRTDVAVHVASQHEVGPNLPV